MHSENRLWRYFDKSEQFYLEPRTYNPPMITLRRFYAGPETFHGEIVVLDADESRHLTRVLRLKAGARVLVCDGRGRQVEAEVQRLEQDQAVLRVVRELPPAGESPLAVTLAIGLAKGDALDAVMRQATEMGVNRIAPFTSVYSEKSDPKRAARRLARWRRLTQESLKTCQRAWVPQIDEVATFADILPGSEEAKIIFWEEERGGGLADLTGSRPASVRLLIGPEGGFAPEEVEQARQAGYRAASLGPRRLRVETAALAALALIQFAWGDLA